PVEVGLYGAAVRYYGLVALASSSIPIVLSAKGTSRSTWENPEQRRRYLLEGGVLATWVLIAFVVASVAARLLLPALFGQEYRGAVPSAVVLALSALPLAVYTPLMYALYAFGLTRTVAIVSLVQLLAAVAMASVLIPLGG